MATVTSKGDVALTNSIIDRSITEIEDEMCGSVGKRAFINCSVLEKADFLEVQRIKEEGFKGCSALNALILRKNSACTFENNALADTPIANGDGYIYVPAEKVDATKGNCVYPDKVRAIEDYIEVCDPYSWDAVFKTIDNGTYKVFYKIGDTIPLDLGSQGVVNMQIVAFDTDDLADGTGKAAISWVAKELLTTTHRVNPALITNDDGTHREGTGAIGGWEKCELRTYLNSTIKPLIPSKIRNHINLIAKTQQAYDVSGTKYAQNTSDEVWIPSRTEVETTGGAYTAVFNSSSTRTKKRVGQTNASSWWLRDADPYGAYWSWWFMRTNGSSNSASPQSADGIALGFCTGKAK